MLYQNHVRCISVNHVNNAKFVIDGGHLLHVVVWPTDATYQDVCDAYATYALRHYNNDYIVVFDGY